MKLKKQTVIKIVLLTACILLFLASPLRAFFFKPGLQERLIKISELRAAPLIYGCVYILGVIFAVPGLPLTVFSGVLFGFFTGSFVAIVASNIGVNITFLISRYLGGDLTQKWSHKIDYLNKLDQRLSHSGFSFMLFLRLLPLVPFNGINYVSGLTRIKQQNYALASLLGMMPGSLLYVYFGSAAIDFKNNPSALILSIALIVAFAVISLWLKNRSDIKEIGGDQSDN